MNLVPQTHQPSPKLPRKEWLPEKGRKHEPFDSGKLAGDQHSVAHALRMDRKR